MPFTSRLFTWTRLTPVGLHYPSRAVHYHVKYKWQLCNGRVWWLGNPQFHNASRVVSCAIFTKVCAAHINYLEISWLLHYPLPVWRHIFTGCSQGGQVTIGNPYVMYRYLYIVSACNIIIHIDKEAIITRHIDIPTLSSIICYLSIIYLISLWPLHYITLTKPRDNPVAWAATLVLFFTCLNPSLPCITKLALKHI